ncbi:unnamed protein product [Phytophthora fragariaefolia]|uniref:Unnamed protein product n=1 Tax=Phytophthora fragariaefolia TaxID=1490495 RepID=A0A9W6TVR0_9STRA|nr:unnamed protein product [Phytophthora fragariaefolia]
MLSPLSTSSKEAKQSAACRTRQIPRSTCAALHDGSVQPRRCLNAPDDVEAQLDITEQSASHVALVCVFQNNVSCSKPVTSSEIAHEARSSSNNANTPNLLDEAAVAWEDAAHAALASRLLLGRFGCDVANSELNRASWNAISLDKTTHPFQPVRRRPGFAVILPRSNCREEQHVRVACAADGGDQDLDGARGAQGEPQRAPGPHQDLPPDAGGGQGASQAAASRAPADANSAANAAAGAAAPGQELPQRRGADHQLPPERCGEQRGCTWLGAGDGESPVLAVQQRTDGLWVACGRRTSLSARSTAASWRS